MAEPIRVLVVDDHPLYREGVATSLDREPGIVVVGQVGSGSEALNLAAEVKPEIVLLDLAMKGMNGLVVLPEFAKRYPSIKVIMLTVSEDSADLLGAVDGGARGYVLKGVSATELAVAIHDVAGGNIYVTPSLAGTVLSEINTQPQDQRLLQLTERELEVLRLVGRGLTNREIGAELFVGEKTVKFHMTSVLRKLNVRNRVEAALVIQQSDPDDGTAPPRFQ